MRGGGRVDKAKASEGVSKNRASQALFLLIGMLCKWSREECCGGRFLLSLSLSPLVSFATTLAEAANFGRMISYSAQAGDDTIHKFALRRFAQLFRNQSCPATENRPLDLKCL